ncbi:hypothetical protein HN425_01815, partial [Candidatus Woesearchaeota archaeon]|nr:hypothetical protein [Candidatus Woesearchaeota archaeon]
MSKLEQICKFYDISVEVGKGIIGKFPPFAGYNHSKVVNEAIEVYGINNEVKIKESIMKFPRFAGYNHSKVVNEAIEVYGINNE